jgi:hypothetical protein
MHLIFAQLILRYLEHGAHGLVGILYIPLTKYSYYYTVHTLYLEQGSISQLGTRFHFTAWN